MSLTGSIIYDANALAAMSTSELLCQLIAREDLRRPNRERRIASKRMHNQMIAKAQIFLNEVGSLGVPQLSAELNAIVQKFALASQADLDDIGVESPPTPPAPTPADGEEVIL